MLRHIRFIYTPYAAPTVVPGVREKNRGFFASRTIQHRETRILDKRLEGGRRKHCWSLEKRGSYTCLGHSDRRNTINTAALKCIFDATRTGTCTPHRCRKILLRYCWHVRSSTTKPRMLLITILIAYLGCNDSVDHGRGHHSSSHEAQGGALGLLRLSCGFHCNAVVSQYSIFPLTVAAARSKTEVCRIGKLRGCLWRVTSLRRNGG